MQVFVRAKICPDPCKRGLSVHRTFTVLNKSLKLILLPKILILMSSDFWKSHPTRISHNSKKDSVIG